MPGHRSKKRIGHFRKNHKRSNREQISDDEVKGIYNNNLYLLLIALMIYFYRALILKKYM